MMHNFHARKLAVRALAVVAAIGCFVVVPKRAPWFGWPVDPIEKFVLSAIAAGVMLVALPFSSGDGLDDWFGGSGDGDGDGGGD